MLRVDGVSVSQVKEANYQNIYSDIGPKNPNFKNQASWIAPVVETALAYGLITKSRDVFSPDRDVTRAEAYAMIMKSVCLAPSNTKIDNTADGWQKNVYESAYRNGLTVKSWKDFSPNRPIMRQELYTMSSRAADWAERTGGCNPKPTYCFLDDASVDAVTTKENE